MMMNRKSDQKRQTHTCNFRLKKKKNKFTEKERFESCTHYAEALIFWYFILTKMLNLIVNRLLDNNITSLSSESSSHHGGWWSSNRTKLCWLMWLSSLIPRIRFVNCSDHGWKVSSVWSRFLFSSSFMFSILYRVNTNLPIMETGACCP